MDEPDSPSAGSLPPPGARAPEQVRAQLLKILASPEFAQSHRLKNFLRFIVEETLAGRATSLKEYTIALDVFGREQSFDPQTSSIVRVEASRLRAKLAQYYAGTGSDDAVQITLPVGTYVPTFDRPAALSRDGAHSDKRDRLAWARPTALAIALAVSLVGALAFLLPSFVAFGPGADRPSVLAPRESGYSFAVLPFRNLSGDVDQEYFSDGITDALIARLAEKAVGRVISMTSVMAYKNVNRPIGEIARELNVSHVIEGSALAIGDQVRITVQLVEATSDRHLWAETYVRGLADVLAIQDDVVDRVVASLPGRVPVAADAGAKEAPRVHPAAYEAQLKGRFFRNKMTAEGLQKGIAYFKQAIELDPDYALAYSGMASCQCLLGGHGFELVRPSEGMPAAKAAVLQALRLDDSLAEAHSFLGIIRLKYEWDWPGAEAAFRRSIQLNPSYAQARLFYSFYLEAMGRQEEAVREAEAARSIDPLSPAANVNLGWQYLQAGRLEDARRQFESTAELNPDFWGVHWGFGHYHRRKGALGRAVAAFREAIDRGGGHTLPLTDLGYTYGISNRPDQARDVLDRLAALAAEGYVSPFNMATVHAGLGEADAAFAWLDKAFVARSRSMAWLKVNRDFDGLRSDPRFRTLLRRIGLPE